VNTVEFRCFINQPFNCPCFIREFQANSRSASERGMDFAKVIRSRKQRDCVPVIFQFAGISQTQTSKAFVEMSHGQIGAFNIRRIDFVGLWDTSLDSDFNAGALRWRIAARGLRMKSSSN
jgi:hypothetical protein